MFALRKLDVIFGVIPKSIDRGNESMGISQEADNSFRIQIKAINLKWQLSHSLVSIIELFIINIFKIIRNSWVFTRFKCQF